jgi:hypothetical protein
MDHSLCILRAWQTLGEWPRCSHPVPGPATPRWSSRDAGTLSRLLESIKTDLPSCTSKPLRADGYWVCQYLSNRMARLHAADRRIELRFGQVGSHRVASVLVSDRLVAQPGEEYTRACMISCRFSRVLRQYHGVHTNQRRGSEQPAAPEQQNSDRDGSGT